MDPQTTEWMLLIFVALAAVMLVLERRFPYRPVRLTRTIIRSDILHLLLRASDGVMRAFFVAHILVLLSRLGGQRNFAGLAAGWPFWLQLVSAFLVLDLVHWLTHLAEHKIPFLWKLHAVHHGVHQMYWGATFRGNFLSLVLYAFTYSFPIAVFGFGEKVLFIMFTARFVLSIPQHANVSLRLGWLNYVVCTWEVHRWHHALDHDAWDTNFGTMFPLWDLLFGTFFWPPRREPIGFGIDAIPDFPQSFLRCQLAPLLFSRWRRQGGFPPAEAYGRPDAS